MGMEGLEAVTLAATGSTPATWEGERAQVMGYGTIGPDDTEEDNNPDNDFRTMTLTIANCETECSEPPCHHQDGSGIVCTRDPSGDVCAGDSGGPLLVAKIEDGQPSFLQIGTVSQGSTGSDCIDRINNPDEDSGNNDSWAFVPASGAWMCDVTGTLCDPGQSLAMTLAMTLAMILMHVE